MKNNDMFDDIDDVTLESISQDFPVLTEEERERMYAMSKRKYNVYKDNGKESNYSNEEEVRGVEHYKRPVMRMVSAAAALMILIGVGSYGGYTLLQLRNSESDDIEVIPSETSAETTQPETAPPADPREEEYREAAEALIGEYEDFIYPYVDDELSVPPENEPVDITSMTEEEIRELREQMDEEEKKYYKRLSFSLLNSPDSENWMSNKGYYYVHYTTGMKYSNTDEVMEKALSFMSQSFIDRQFTDLIGDDLTGYGDNAEFDINGEHPDFGTFIMYDGELYCTVEPNTRGGAPDSYWNTLDASYYFNNRHDESVVITDIEDDSFTACVKYDITSVPNKTDMTMKAVKKDGKWIIDDIEATSEETDQQKTDIVNKMLNSCDMCDNISAKVINVTEYKDGDGAVVQVGAEYADNRAYKAYSFRSDYTSYSGENSIDAVSKYAEGVNFDDITRVDEDYCDGEKNYYWCNPSEVYPDGWYHWSNYIPHDGDAEKYGGIEKLKVDKANNIILEPDGIRPMLCPNGRDEVYDYLYDFSKWDITGEINFSGRDCYVIDYGRTDEEAGETTKITFYIDKETGIPLAEYDVSSEHTTCKVYYDVRLNEEAEAVPEIDMSQYDMNAFTYK